MNETVMHYCAVCICDNSFIKNTPHYRHCFGLAKEFEFANINCHCLVELFALITPPANLWGNYSKVW